MDKWLSTELSASKYYINTYAQESVDKGGQKSVDNPAKDFSRLKPEKPRGGRLAVGGRDPPRGRFGGGDCGGTKHLQKKFFKNLLR